MSKATGPLCNQLRISQYYSAGAVFVSVRLPGGWSRTSDNCHHHCCNEQKFGAK